MTPEDDQELVQYRAEVRGWLEQHLPRRTRGRRSRAAHAPSADDVTASKAVQLEMYEAGYVGITLPTSYGGQGLTPDHERIWYEESSSYAVPIPRGTSTLVTLGIILPTVLAHGTEEQKRAWVPKMLSGEETWAQLLSEPAAGSDLAGLRTRATRDGESWILAGAKVWSSGADVADFGICLARTNWDVPKHRGLTWFRVPLHDERITVRPIREISGGAAFCEEFLDGVVVGDDAVIGQVNGGWTVANTLLSVERSGGPNGGHGITADPEGVSPGTRAAQLPADLVALATKRGRTDDPATRQLIARAQINDYMHAQLTARVMQLITSGSASPAAASYLKLSIGTLLPRRAQLAMEVAGQRGIAWDPEIDGSDATAMNYLNGRIMAIGGGSDQIQRNIIGERLLGLPREPSFDTDKPFREVLEDAKTWGQS
jgi:alkylation response protein AidB-like acyl-CoA dehydrogenase